MGKNPQRETIFRMKQFDIVNRDSAMKPGTDGVLLGAWAYAENPVNILDVGTGTGLIALMMAQRFPDAMITGMEIESTAAAEASYNFKHSKWADRLTLINDDFLNSGFDGSFDLIVSNPPFFISGNTSPYSARATARHEGSLTYPGLFEKSATILSASGVLALITPADVESEILYFSAIHKLYPERICKVVSVEGKSPKRILWEFSKTNGPTSCEELIIKEKDNGFTSAYRNLTKNFYLNF